MKNTNHKFDLIIGVGNSGRSDDGLGWAFLDQIDGHIDAEIIYRYQLNIEDAELISHHQNVLVVDAQEKKLENGYQMDKVLPKDVVDFSTHSLSPEYILFLCNEIYHKKPVLHVLGIQGFKWDLNIGLSEKAEKNLNDAIQFISVLCNFVIPA